MTDPLQRWVDLTGDEPTGRELLGRWAEPHRGYHDARHLREVLRAADELLAREPAEPRPVLLAAYWHDAVYDPTRADNEERSARLAVVALTALGLPGPLVEQVARLVRLTAGHNPVPADHEGAVLCDADLAVLASGPQRYAEYVAGVRAEHAHLRDELFARGRAAVLAELLAHRPLFRTVAGRQRWESAARANLAAELTAGGAVDAARRPSAG